MILVLAEYSRAVTQFCHATGNLTEWRISTKKDQETESKALAMSIFRNTHALFWAVPPTGRSENHPECITQR
jgi:hypothetical protein